MWILVLLWGCRSSSIQPSPAWDDHLRIVLGTGKSCTIVGLHGRGDSPERFRGLYDPMKLDATVILPRAPNKLRPKAYSWFARQRDVTETELGEQIAAQADRLAQALDRSPAPNDRIVVTGFSQGGMLSFALAARHSGKVDAALPIGGRLPPSLHPNSPGPTSLRGFHGEIDQVVPLHTATATMAAFEKHGWDASMRTYPNIAHHVPTPMRIDYERALKEACEP